MGRLSKRKLERNEIKVTINLISKKKPIILLIHYKQKEYISNLFLNNDNIIQLGEDIIINKNDISNIIFK